MKRYIISVVLAVFALAGAEGRGLRVAFVGDPQVDNAEEMLYARASVYKELAGRKDIDFAVILGDLVNDNVSLIEESRRIIDSLPFPCYVVPGNHDFDIYKDKRRDLESFIRVFGHTDTSFVDGKNRFILMNNVRIIGKNSYKGGFNERQKHYLDSLVGISRGMKVFLATHIPVSGSEGRDSVYNILSGSDAVLFAGHTHFVSRNDIELPDGKYIPEIIAGASCGSWWRGIKDEYGVPYALQRCGAPRGYFIADIKPSRISLEYKVIGKDSREVSSAHIVESDSTAVLTVNVFGGATAGEVSVRKCGSQKKYRLTKTDVIAPEVEQVLRYNATIPREQYRSRKSEIIPMRRLKSPHIWTAPLPDSYAEGDKIYVFYTDKMMKFRQKLTVRK